MSQEPALNDNLLEDIHQLIQTAKADLVSRANSTLTMLFWHIGKRISETILHNQRAEYGKEIVVTLSRHLVEKFGNTYQVKNLRRMIQFAQSFAEYEKVVTLSRQLSWSHFLILIPIKDKSAKDFYGTLASTNLMSVRELRKCIEQKTFERTETVNLRVPDNSELTKGVFKDPYLLDFLDIKDGYVESDLESAIIKDLELFILELGMGFTFVARQKRLIIDGEDFYLDLLFYHRKLKRLVAIELKIGKFKASYKGQMELYLSWLNKYERQDGENSPIGLILCAEARTEQIELLDMTKDGIMVAEYWTDLPPKDKLETKLQQALKDAKERLERKLLNQ